MKIRSVLFCVVLALATMIAFAADINGKWTAEVAGRGGQTATNTFTFKVDGDKLTGTVQGPMGGPADIKNGKVSGDEISFTVERDMGDKGVMKQLYKGAVSGNEIKMSVQREGGQGQAREFVAKRSTT